MTWPALTRSVAKMLISGHSLDSAAVPMMLCDSVRLQLDELDSMASNISLDHIQTDSSLDRQPPAFSAAAPAFSACMPARPSRY
jgi:hypothetical protein